MNLTGKGQPPWPTPLIQEEVGDRRLPKPGFWLVKTFFHSQ